MNRFKVIFHSFQQNKLLNAQLGLQQTYIQELMQSQATTPNSCRTVSGNRGGSGNRNNGPLLSQDYHSYSDEDNRDESDTTAFETPFHSFMASNEDEEVSSSRRSNSRKVSSSTTSSQSSAIDYVQIPTIGSTTTPTHRNSALFVQGVLRDANQNLSEGLDDLSLSSNQMTDPNDLTPTMDVVCSKATASSYKRHQSMESPLSNDALIRAKQLVDRASLLNEQIQAKK